MKKTIYSLLAFLCFVVSHAHAQFNMSAEIRPRTEFRNGFKRLPSETSNPALFTEQRSRITMDFLKENIKMKVSFQDVRIWGSEPQINKSDALSSFHEAWGEVLFSKKFSARLGRQEFVYDDSRILGNLDWAAQGRSHDAVLFVFQDSTWSLHGAIAYNQDNNTPEGAKLFGAVYNPVINNYKQMQFLWFQKQVSSSFEFTVLALNQGLQDPAVLNDPELNTVNFSQTLGTNFSVKLNRSFKFAGTYYYQMGKDKAGKELSAYLASAKLTYSGIKNLAITAGGDIVSGTDASEENKSNTFDPLYGTHHIFYGLMDYFYVGNPHNQNGRSVGLIDTFLKLQFKTSAVSGLGVHLHQFNAYVPVLDPTDANVHMKSSLGTEIDLVYNRKIANNITLVGGYSQMFATETMEVIKGGSRKELANWAWVMININPVLFTNGK